VFGVLLELTSSLVALAGGPSYEGLLFGVSEGVVALGDLRALSTTQGVALSAVPSARYVLHAFVLLDGESRWTSCRGARILCSRPVPRHRLGFTAASVQRSAEPSMGSCRCRCLG
jgi:hypothetical protein